MRLPCDFLTEWLTVSIVSGYNKLYHSKIKEVKEMDLLNNDKINAIVNDENFKKVKDQVVEMANDPKVREEATKQVNNLVDKFKNKK